jgi:hypothetical protein
MGSYQKEAEQKKEAAADAEWFAEKMALLVSELKSTPLPLRAQYLRACLSSAMDFHERCMRGVTAPKDAEL